MQGSLFPPPSDWRPPTSFPELGGSFACDLETRDPLLKKIGAGWAFDMSSEIRGYVVGIGVANDEGQWYFPIRHEGGGNLDPDAVFRWLSAQFAVPGRKVFHEWLYDVGWLRAEGVEVRDVEIHDTGYLAALHDERHYKYGLDACGRRYIGEGKDEDLLKSVAKSFRIDPKSDMWKLPSKYVGQYGEQDAGVTWRLFKHLHPLCEKEDLIRCYDMERRLMPIIYQMRVRGCRVDLDRADEVKRILQEKERAQLELIKSITGYKAREGVPSADAAQILRHVGMSIPQTGAGNDSVVASWLERLDHPVAAAINGARRYNKAYRDFIDSGIFGYQVNGRIHASFHPLRSDDGGTVTGRFSCTDPNLQQIPSRNPEIGPLIRSCYVGELGEKWGAPDYSSQEPRWTLHFAVAINAPGALAAAQIFRDNPRTDFHGLMTDIIWPDLIGKSEKERKPFRRQAKDIFLGKCYGMGGAKLCRQLGLPTSTWTTPDGKEVEVAGDAGREIINRFDNMAKFVKKLSDRCAETAKNRGFVWTHDGRRLHVDFDYKAMNKIIQGSAAGQVKKSMIAVYEEHGKIPMLQVHDELAFSVVDDDENKRLCHTMEHCIPDLNVPFVVESITADNWGACK